jgi:hypothetical protein
MAVGAPRSTINPHFREFERICVCLSLRVESPLTSAENGNFLGLFVFFNHDRGAGKPFTGANFFRIELDIVAAVNSSPHPTNWRSVSSLVSRVSDQSRAVYHIIQNLDAHFSAVELDA